MESLPDLPIAFFKTELKPKNGIASGIIHNLPMASTISQKWAVLNCPLAMSPPVQSAAAAE
jgi:hypothetical protein